VLSLAWVATGSCADRKSYRGCDALRCFFEKQLGRIGDQSSSSSSRNTTPPTKVLIRSGLTHIKFPQRISSWNSSQTRLAIADCGSPAYFQRNGVTKLAVFLLSAGPDPFLWAAFSCRSNHRPAQNTQQVYIS